LSSLLLLRSFVMMSCSGILMGVIFRPISATPGHPGLVNDVRAMFYSVLNAERGMLVLGETGVSRYLPIEKPCQRGARLIIAWNGMTRWIQCRRSPHQFAGEQHRTRTLGAYAFHLRRVWCYVRHRTDCA
jgi:hypothetical protein